MDPITARIPVFVTQRGRHILFGGGKTRGVEATFIVDPARPHLLSISTPWFVTWLNRKGVAKGLDGHWTEADGDVTVRPHQSAEVLWLVVDINSATFPAAQIAATHERVAAFLSMVDDLLALGFDDVFEALVPRPAGRGDFQHEWPVRPLRNDGGAL